MNILANHLPVRFYLFGYDPSNDDTSEGPDYYEVLESEWVGASGPISYERFTKHENGTAFISLRKNDYAF